MGQALDITLAILYGKCINVAYAMYLRDRTQLEPEPAANEIPDPYELVAWLNMSDFILADATPKFYGFIARNKNDKHDFILAIRGTEGWMEWFDDAEIHPVPFTQVPDAGLVLYGFDRIYSSLQVIRRDRASDGAIPAAMPVTSRRMRGSFAQQLEQLADSLEEPEVQQKMLVTAAARPRRTFVVSGHSLGSALATLFVIENKDKKKFDITTSCTFASPRVGNTAFVGAFNELPINSWRIFNEQDIVPKIPFSIPLIADFEHVNDSYSFSSLGVVKWNPVCWHSMLTYLHWLDGNIAVLDTCKV